MPGASRDPRKLPEIGDMTTWGGSARHSFPPNGLVALSRKVCGSTPQRTTRIRPAVYVFGSAGGNVTAIGGRRDGAIVDSSYGARIGEIEHSVTSARGRAPQWLVNTHWHFDHTDGNEAFASAGAAVLGHTNCRVRLSTDQFVRSLSWRVSASSPKAWPTLTVDHPVTIDIGAEELRLIPRMPAHTDGDVAILLISANALIIGDLFTNGSYPVIDEASGGSLHRMIEAIDRLMPLINAGTVVVPGHGATTDRAGLLAYRDMLRSIEHRLLAMIEAQCGIPEILAAQPTAALDANRGRGYVTGEHLTRMALAGTGLIKPPVMFPVPGA